MVIWLSLTVITGFRLIVSLTIFLLVKYTQKRLFYIQGAHLIFDRFLIDLRALMYSICRIRVLSMVLKILA